MMALRSREPAHGDAILVPHTLDSQKGMALAQEAAQRAGVRIEITNNLVKDLPRARALVYLTRSEGLARESCSPWPTA